MSSSKKQKRQLRLEALEPRIMLSGSVDIEPDNDDWEHASDLGLLVGPNNYTTDLELSSNSDEDWYRFEMADPGDQVVHSVKANFDHSDGDIDMALHRLDGDSPPVATSSGSTNVKNWETISLDGEPAGTYYVHLYGAENTYELVIVTPLGDDQYDREPNDNDDSGSATDLGVQYGERTIAGLVAMTGDPDWYEFSLDSVPEGDAIDDFVTLSYYRGDPQLEVYKPGSGVPLAVDSVPGAIDTKIVDLTAGATGVYQIHVSGGEDQSYFLTLRGDDALEDNDTSDAASAINADPGFDNTVSDLAALDEDWYTFTIADTGGVDDFVAIGSQNVTESLEMDLLWTDKSGEEPVEQTRASTRVVSTWTVSLQDLEPSYEDGTAINYYVHVHSGINPSYTLTIHGPGEVTHDDALEEWDDAGVGKENDTFAEATPLEDTDTGDPVLTGTNTYLNLVALDDDYYCFTTDQRAKLGDTVSITFADALGDLELELLDSSETVIRNDSGPGNSHSVRLFPLPADTYYIHVYGYDEPLDDPDEGPDTNPYYVLTVEAPGVGEDDYEGALGNDTRADAYDLGDLGGRHVYPDLGLVDEADWYQLTTLEEGAPWDGVTIEFPYGADGELGMRLWGDDDVTPLETAQPLLGGLGAQLERATVASVSLNTQPAGVYFIEVYPMEVDNANSYSLIFNAPGPREDGYEQNDVQEEAHNFSPITLAHLQGEPLEGPNVYRMLGCLDSDYYVFRTNPAVPATAENGVTIDFAHVLGDLDMEVWYVGETNDIPPYPADLDTELTVVGSVEEVGDSHTVPLISDTHDGAAGWYLVHVYGYDGDINPYYTLTIDAPRADDEFDTTITGNDTATTAAWLGTLYTPEVFPQLMALDDDFYTFTTIAPGLPRSGVTVTYPSGDGDLDLFVYTAASVLAAPTTEGSWVSVGDAVPLPQVGGMAGQTLSLAEEVGAGMYFIKVAGADGAQIDDYTLTINPPHPVLADMFEPNNTQEDAAPLFTLLGETSFEDLDASDEDWYSIVTTAVGKFGDRVAIEFEHDEGDIDLQLVRADGTVIAEASGWGDVHELSLDGLGAGQYYVRVYGDANPAYSLTVRAPSLPTPLDDDYERNNTMGAASEGSPSDLRTLEGVNTFSGLVGNDDDWYRFETQAGGLPTHGVGIAFLHNAGDLDLEVVDVNGDPVGHDTGLGNTHTVSLAGAPAGVYYAHVYGVDGATNPSYVMTVNAPTAGDDEFEANNARPDAHDFGEVKGFNTYDGLVSNNDDWYQFTTTLTGRTVDNATIAFLHGAGDLELELYDNAGTRIDAATGWGNTHTVKLTGLAAETYYLRVFGFDGATNPYYALTITAPTNEDDEHEENDTKGEATDLLTLNQPEVLHLSVLDDDWFRFETTGIGVPGNGVAIAFLQADGDIDLEVQNEAGDWVVESIGVGNGHAVSLAGQPAGTYYARVFGVDGATNPDCVLTIAPPTSLEDMYEENNDQGGAYDLLLQMGTTVLYGSAQDEDWFKFAIANVGGLSDGVTLDFLHDAGDLDLEVRNEAGDWVMSETGYGDSHTVSLAGQLPGTYFVRVHGDTNPAYTLTIQTPLPADILAIDDAYETYGDAENDLQGDAYDFRLLEGQHPFAPLTALDEDWYRFQTSGNGLPGHGVAITFMHDAGNLDLEVIEESGELVGRSTGWGNGEVVSLAGTGAGTYYARVYGGQNVMYALAISAPTTADDDLEENDAQPDATNLQTIEGTQTVQGLVVQDDDWYRFETTSVGGLMDNVIIGFAHTAGDLDLELYDASGTPIDDATGWGNTHTVKLTGLPAEDYYVRVFSPTGGTNPYYALSITGPSGQDDDLEENDTRPEAHDFGPVEGLLSELNLISNDPDWYRFETTGPGLPGHGVSIAFLHAAGDLDLEVVAEDGTPIGEDVGYGNGHRVSLAGVPAGVYYAHVFGANGATNPEYAFHVVAPAGMVPEDWAEAAGGDTQGNAYDLLTLAGTYLFEGLTMDSFEIPGSDWFMFKTAAPGEVQVEIQYDQTQGDLGVRVLTADGAEYFGGPGLGTEVARVPAASPFAVTAYLPSVSPVGMETAIQMTKVPAASPFAVTAYLPSVSPVGMEPVMQMARLAATSPIGMTGQEMFVAGMAIGTDALQIPSVSPIGMAPSAKVVRVPVASPVGVLGAEMFGLSGMNQIPSVSPIGMDPTTKVVRIPSVSPIGIVVNVTGNANMMYTMKISTPDEPLVFEDLFEQNDTRAEAYDLLTLEGLNLWAPLTMDGSDNEPAKEDWYQFDTVAEGLPNHMARIDFTHSQGDLDLALYDASGNLLVESATTDDGEEVSLDGQPAGTYYLLVSGYEGATNPYYWLSVDAPVSTDPADIAQDWAEQNDSLGEAYDLRTLAGHGHEFPGLTMDDSASEAAHEDWYEFTLVGTGRSIDEVRIDFLNAQGDLDLELYNEIGTLLVSSDGTDDVERVSLEGQPAGVYYAQVSGVPNPDYTLIVDAPPAPTGMRDWTVLVYLCGDTSGLERFGIADVNEMESVDLPADVAVAVLFDRVPGQAHTDGNWTDTREGIIVHDGRPRRISTPFASLGELNMGDPQTLTDFIDWGAATVPAENYALIMWDHGGGLTGVAWDVTDGHDNITVPELASVLAGSSTHIDVLGFDACLMAMAEVGYAVRDYTDVIVASEDLEPGPGWDYGRFLSTFTTETPLLPEDVGERAVAAFADSYGNAATLSATAASEYDDLAMAVATFATAALDHAIEDDWNAMLQAREVTPFFYDDDYRDLRTFMDMTASYVGAGSIATAADAVVTALDNAVIANHSGTAHQATGLSVYLPGSWDVIRPDYTEANFAFAVDPWVPFLRELTSHQYLPPPTEPITGDWAEVNDVMSQAYDLRALSGHGLAFDDLNVLDADDVDWFHFETAVVGAASDDVQIDFDHALGDLSLYLYAADGTLLEASETAADVEVVSLDGRPAGSYFLEVVGVAGADNFYTMTVNAPPGSGDWASGNSTADKSYTISSDGTVAGHLGGLVVSGIGQDWFSFRPGRPVDGGVLTLEIESTSANGDLDLYLYDEDGNEVASSQNQGNSEGLALGDPTTQMYRVQVVSTEDAGDVPYSMRVAYGPGSAEIHGVKWHDLDGNGIQDTGEPGLPGWTVYLDADENGRLDDGEPERITGPDGEYGFTDLGAGTYVVREIPQAGWQQTAPAAGALSFDAVAEYDVGDRPRPVVAGDFDGDGLMDLAVADVVQGQSASAVSVLLNDANDPGTFLPATQFVLVEGETGPGALTTGDFNGDGAMDIVVASTAATEEPIRSNVTLLLNLNDGSGGFEDGIKFPISSEWSPTGPPTAIQAADLDGDGDLDLAVANLMATKADQVSVLLNTGSPTDPDFPVMDQTHYPVGHEPKALVVGDLNGDGAPDLATANLVSNDVSILLNTNDGSGEFEDAEHWLAGSAYLPIGLTTGDFDGDSDLDLAVATQFSTDQSSANSTVVVLWNDGFAAFRDADKLLVGLGATSVAAGDLDGDGDLDLAAANIGDGDLALNEVSILLNLGRGAFAAAESMPTTNGPTSVLVADLDASGQVDLAMSFLNVNTVGVALNATPAGAHVIDLTDDEVHTGADFGNRTIAEPGQIQGYKWHDLDGDGVWDNGEPVLADWEIYLDENGNGQWDEGEPKTTTGPDGSYVFSNVLPGAHTVAEVVPTGWEQTYPIDELNPDGLVPENVVPQPPPPQAQDEVYAGRLTVTDMATPTADEGLLTAEDLAEMLVGDEGVVISNVQFTGRQTSAGAFNGGFAAGIGIESGVVLGSGYVRNAEGPNTSDSTTGVLMTLGDADLNDLLFAALPDDIPPAPITFDATILEFDFQTSNEYISFQYVFASDEYNEFVFSVFNDVFGFFLDGQNIALIPDSESAVAINYVNYAFNREYYRNNDRATVGSPYDIEYDGFTAVLQAAAPVEPDVTHHIKLAIADVSDMLYDSAVFIGQSTLVSGLADVSIEKGDTLVLPDGTVEYTLTVANDGPDEATNVVVSDTLPEGVVVVSVESEGANQEVAGTVVVDVGTLAAAEEATITITVVPTETGVITDVATVSSSEYDPDLSNNTAVVATGVGEGNHVVVVNPGETVDEVNFGNWEPDPAPDLIVETFDGPANALPGQALDGALSLTIANVGNLDATGAFDTAFVLSTNEVIGDGDDIPLTDGVTTIGGLSQGQSHNVVFDGTNTIPSSVPLGHYYLAAVVDSGEAIAEREEGNNVELYPILIGQLGVVRGSKWEDLNGDGVWDNGENGLQGWTIYADENLNGRLDEGEEAVVTGSDGSFEFADVPPGTYRLMEVPQPGWLQTNPPPATGLAFDRTEYDVGTTGTNMTSADVDGDDYPELILATTQASASQASVFVNDGDGTFAAPTHFPAADGLVCVSIVAADFNGDGDVDLALANEAATTLGTVRSNAVVMLNDGSGGFSDATKYPLAERTSPAGLPAAIRAGDFNGDGHQDLAVATVETDVIPTSANEVYILWNAGDGTFSLEDDQTRVGVGGNKPVSLVVEDFNSDGYADLATLNADTDDRAELALVLYNPNTTSFDAPVLLGLDAAVTPVSLTSADIDGDGHVDLAVASQTSLQQPPTPNVTVLWNAGDGDFSIPQLFPTATAPRSLRAGDFNLDGHLDLIMTSTTLDDLGQVAVLVNNHDRGFGPPATFDAGTAPAALTPGDFDLDGATDVAALNAIPVAAKVSVLINETQSGGHTVTVDWGETIEDVDFGNLQVGDELDYGDAPDDPDLPIYPTLFVNNGAAHVIESGLFLGTSVDADVDGQPAEPFALGDDYDGNDDEDGVTFTSLLVIGENASVEVVAPQGGVLDAWIDFNGNRTWADADDQIFAGEVLNTGTNSLEFVVPDTAIPGLPTFARFRLSTEGGLSYDGLALDGEVEDYIVGIEPEGDMDYGDAPSSYATLLADNGARHGLSGRFYLGAEIDLDTDGQPDANALGDDNDGGDDEDGVAFVTPLASGEPAVVIIDASEDGAIDAWIDFNGDGSWAEQGDRIFVSAPVERGLNALEFMVPSSATPDITTFARFRYSVAGGLPWYGPAPDGEVEDYEVAIESGPSLPDVWVMRGYDHGYPAEPATNGYEVEVGGDDITRLGVLTPWGVVFDTATYLGEVWDGSTVEVSETGFELDAYTDEGVREICVGWWALSTPEWDLVDTGTTQMTVVYGDDVWTGTVGFGGVPIPDEVPDVTDPAHEETGVALQPTIEWTGWTPSGPNPGIWYELEVEDTGQLLYEEDSTSPDQVDWAPPQPLDTDIEHEFDLSFYYSDTVLVNGVDVNLESFRESSMLFTTEAGVELDFGDAPAPYPTLSADNGASHVVVGGVLLGATVDAETDGQPHPTADGDVPDEGGVIFTGPLPTGDMATIDVVASTTGFLNAWVDFNGDGDWNDPDEDVAVNWPMSAGSNPVHFPVPADALLGGTFARFRFSTQEGLAPTGPAPDGEVEDYAVLIGEGGGGAAAVVGRHIFYNQSYFDGNDASPGTGDDNAIATDKTALLPGNDATFANYTSYSRGINGIMVDIDDLADPTGIGPTNFQFRVGNTADPSAWPTGPTPTILMVREGAGESGSDRVTLIWANNAIEKEWLQVTVLADSITGLTAPDVFYFGNAIGESGNSPTNTYVDGTDFAVARDNFHDFMNRASVDYPYDYNRDSFVDGTDMAVARDNNTNVMTALTLLGASQTQGASMQMASQGETVVGDVAAARGTIAEPQPETGAAVDDAAAADPVAAEVAPTAETQSSPAAQPSDADAAPLATNDGGESTVAEPPAPVAVSETPADDAPAAADADAAATPGLDPTIAPAGLATQDAGGTNTGAVVPIAGELVVSDIDLAGDEGQVLAVIVDGPTDGGRAIEATATGLVLTDGREEYVTPLDEDEYRMFVGPLVDRTRSREIGA